MKKLFIIVSIVSLGLFQAYSQGDEHRQGNKGQEHVAMTGDSAHHHCCAMHDSLKCSQGNCCKQMHCCGHEYAMKMCGDRNGCGGDGSQMCYGHCCMKHHCMILPFLFFVLLLIVTIFTFKYLRNKQKYQIILKSLEVGQPIPENLLETMKCKRCHLTRSIILISLGLGIGLACLLMHRECAAASGIVLIFLGLAFLLLHFIDKSKDKKE